MLEQQLAQMRATYLLNSEKLEYNFQVGAWQSALELMRCRC